MFSCFALLFIAVPLAYALQQPTSGLPRAEECPEQSICYSLGLHGPERCSMKKNCVMYVVLNYGQTKTDDEDSHVQVVIEFNRSRMKQGNRQAWTLFGLSHDRLVGNDLVFTCTMVNRDVDGMVGFLTNLSEEPHEINYSSHEFKSGHVFGNRSRCNWKLDLPIRILTDGKRCGNQLCYFFMAFGVEDEYGSRTTLNSQISKVVYNLSNLRAGFQMFKERSGTGDRSWASSQGPLWRSPLTDSETSVNYVKQENKPTATGTGFASFAAAIAFFVLFVIIIGAMVAYAIYRKRRNRANSEQVVINTTSNDPYPRSYMSNVKFHMTRQVQSKPISYEPVEYKTTKEEFPRSFMTDMKYATASQVHDRSSSK